MSKRTLIRLVTCICSMLCVIFLGQVIAFADTIDESIKPTHEYTFDNDTYNAFYDSVIGEKAINGYADNGILIPGYDGTGKARRFDGSCYLSFEKNQNLIPVGEISIRFKIKKDSAAASIQPIISSSNTNTLEKIDELFFIGIDKNYTGYLWIYRKDNIDNFELKTPVSICDGKWHDVLFTWDGTKKTNSVKLYVDDMTAPIAQTTARSADLNKRGLTLIGKTLYYTSFQYYKGDLDNLQFYDSVITASSATPGDPTTPDPTKLIAVGSDSKVNLSWPKVKDATSYTLKRATTAGGPYTAIANDIFDTSFTDTDVTNGTTYYYVVSTIVNGTESNSNEASATPEPSQTPPATETKLKVVLEVAEALRLSVDNDLNVNTQMAWSSSEPTVATVNEKGIVTALAPGNTIITVKSADGSYTDYINVLVVENADDYRLAIDLKVGETARLTADDYTNTANITWAPMDSSIANVTTKGKVTALSKGLVLISAKDADGNIIGRVYVRVRE